MHSLKFNRIFPVFNLVVGLILTQMSFTLAVFSRHQIAIGKPIAESWLCETNISIRLIITIVWGFFLSLFAVYSNKQQLGLMVELKALGSSLIASFSVLVGLIFMLNYDEFSRLLYLYFIAINTVILVASHIGMYIILALRGRPRDLRRVLIVGTGPLAESTAHVLINRGFAEKIEIVGFLSKDSNELVESHGLPVLGNLEDAPFIMEKQRVQDVIIALPHQERGGIGQLIRKLQELPIRIRLVPDAIDYMLIRSTLEEVAGVTLLNLTRLRLQVMEHYAKRIFDFIGAFIGLIILSPLLFVIALLIKLDSPGPVLFRQTRVGKNGRLFTFYKFRSMVHNADQRVHQEYMHKLIKGSAESYRDLVSGEQVLKMTTDERITRFGRFLRKSSLDELPQLFNVIKGDMSFVGPRPPIPYEVEEYKEWHKRRLEATPGITGLWQVRGRSRVSFDEMIQMDIDYIDRQSLWLDLKIIILTPYAVITGRGAG